MTATNRQTPATVTELFTQYLKGQVSAREQGLAIDLPEGEVVPYEATPVQPVDARQAWEDGMAVTKLFAEVDSKWAPPHEWPALVAAQEPAVALAFCVGNFPQMVRNLQPLLSSGDPAALRVNTGRIVAPPGLMEWTGTAREPAQVVIAAAALRLARHFDEAEALLKPVTRWQSLVANERAALAWHAGRFDEAAAQWRSQAASAPVLFNRGMAALFLGNAAAARADLDQGVRALPETSAWHHLGRLYLALADAR